jgi:hypothetical protein
MRSRRALTRPCLALAGGDARSRAAMAMPRTMALV